MKVYDKDVATTGTVDIEAKTFSVSLLRPGEAIIFRIDAAEEAFKPDISVEMKSTDMSSSFVLERGLLPQMLAAATAVIVFVGSLFVDDPLPDFSPDISSWWMAFIAALFMFGRFVITMLLGYFVYRLTRRMLIATVSPVAWRFFEIQAAVMSTLETWKKLKLQIDKSEQK